MRRILILITVALMSTNLFAARAERGAGRTGWLERAPLTAATMAKAVANAELAEVSGTRPVVLLETNYYTFLPGEPVELRLTVNPNGFGSPVTMYLYQENRVTGERRYFSVAGGLLAAGQQADLFGAGGGVPVVVPTLNDFVLFGSGGNA